MTPLKLRLKNFLSYGSSVPELDFTAFHLACLTGENGAGKSSLLEAMTWAIWGESRAKNDMVIREGTTELAVEFEFRLSENTYKIVRTYKKGKAASQGLEFQVYDAASDRFRPLTETTTRDTQKKINHTLGISYDVFINSSFILQGRSNEFTAKNAKDRKEILVGMLGLDRYQLLSAESKERAKKMESKAEAKAEAAGRLQAEIEQEPQLLQTVDTLANALLDVKAEVAELTKAKEVVAAALKKIEAVRSESREVQAELASLQKQLATLGDDVKRLTLKKSEFENILNRRVSIEQNLSAYQSLKAEVEKFSEQEKEAARLTQQKRETEFRIETAETKLNAERQSLDRDIRTARQAAEKWQRSLSERPRIETELGKLVTLKTEREANEKLLSQLKSAELGFVKETERLKSLAATLRVQQADIKQKGTTLRDVADARCPLCLSPLDETHRAEVLEKFRTDYKATQDELAKIDLTLAVLNADEQQHTQKLRDAEKKLQSFKALDADFGRLSAELASLAAAESELATLQADIATKQEALATLTAQLDSRTHIQDDLKNLAAIVEALSQLGYNEADAAQAKRAFEAVRNAEVEHEQLKNADVAQHDLVQQLDLIAHRREQLDVQICEQQAKADNLASNMSGETDLLQQDRELSGTLTQKHAAEKDLTVRLEVGKKQLEIIEEKKTALEKLAAEFNGLQEEAKTYRLLEEAFGIKGIQSLIIENAVPELEEKANALLHRLTDGRTTLSIETLKDQKNEKTVETLEIKISDVEGVVRDYDTYSGGEKFRVDFALRIALSKLLSERSGMPIKMLVIDEGFGTQDASGLDAIVEAIHAIKDDFEKIILITHLEKLKDAFDVKIVVTKDGRGGGSSFELLGV
jgi:exonuclease SbcC